MYFRIKNVFLNKKCIFEKSISPNETEKSHEKEKIEQKTYF